MDKTELQSEESSGLIKIERSAFNQDQLDDNFHVYKPCEEKGHWTRLRTKAKQQCSVGGNPVKKHLSNLFPIINWLPKYSWKHDFICDIMSGCTVAVMHIPQGMGYALLGGVTPIVGIYMAFFPVLVYVFLGTSHHISLGTFAVTTLMTGRIVDKYGSPYVNETSEFNLTTDTSDQFTNLEVATAVCLMVGLWQIVMGILRLGVIGIILSDHLVSGFTTAAAIHVLASQMKNLLGIKVPRFSGAFKVIYTFGAIFSELPSVNYAEVIISAITIATMATHNDWVKPWLSKRVKFPIPAELFALVIGTVVAYFANLPEKFGIRVLDYIPTGLPEPQLPPSNLLLSIAFDSVTVAVVAYAVSLSMAKIFSRKLGYPVRNNQELLAQGVSNVVGSFFSCMPVAASLSRSLLQEAVGGKTQIANVVSCFLLLFVLLWVGPFFETLPLAVLASVIVVALKGMFMQVKDFKAAMKTSTLDALVWLITFLTVVIVDIDIGLGVGVLASISVLVYRGHRPHSAVLGLLPGTEIYADVNLYPTATQETGMKIFRWAGGIHFANGETFRNVVDDYLRPMENQPAAGASNGALSNHHPKLELESEKDSCKRYDADKDNDIQSAEPLNIQNDAACSSSPESQKSVEYLIFDCSALSFVDPAGCKLLKNLFNELKKRRQIQLVLASCSSPVVEQLERCEFFKDFPRDRLFPSVLDAVATLKAHSTEAETEPTDQPQCAINP